MAGKKACRFQQHPKSKERRQTMFGNQSVRFSELFKDTVKVFGVVDAWKHYSKHGMQRWEFRFWCKLTLC